MLTENVFDCCSEVATAGDYTVVGVPGLIYRHCSVQVVRKLKLIQNRAICAHKLYPFRARE